MKLNKKTLLIAAIPLLALGGGVYYGTHKSKDRSQYKEAPVTNGTIAITILSTGTVQPENRLEIKPPIAGRVDKVLIHEGEHVKKGQILAWMSSGERAALLDAARADGPEEVKRWTEMYLSLIHI